LRLCLHSWTHTARGLQLLPHSQTMLETRCAISESISVWFSRLNYNNNLTLTPLFLIKKPLDFLAELYKMRVYIFEDSLNVISILYTFDLL
jgi:hypothetical protein